ncbi:MAG TPA: WD40 repeat domain-containing protein [Gemmataceae bacterium]|nr:WD40 repeat domain-containing protein [Gemmataceae bacterium]
MKRRLFLAGCGGLLFQGRQALTAQQVKADMEDLIARLGSRQFQAREAAAKALAKQGEKVLPALRRAAKTSSDPELRRRAASVIRYIEEHPLQKPNCVVRDLGGSPFRSVAVSPGGSTFLWPGNRDKDYDVHLAEIAGGRPVRRFHGHGNYVWTVAFAPDGQRILTGGQDTTIRLWNAATGDQIHCLRRHGSAVTGVGFSRDGLKAISVAPGQAALWDLSAGQCMHVLTARTAMLSAALSPDSRWAITSATDGSLTLWDADNGKELQCLLKGRWGEQVFCVAFSPDGRQALSAGQDHLVRLWALGTGRELRRFAGHRGPVLCARFGPDGRQILSGSQDKTLRLWDTRTGLERDCLLGHTRPVAALAFFSNGRRALSAGKDGTIRLWNLPQWSKQ